MSCAGAASCSRSFPTQPLEPAGTTRSRSAPMRPMPPASRSMNRSASPSARVSPGSRSRRWFRPTESTGSRRPSPIAVIFDRPIDPSIGLRRSADDQPRRRRHPRRRRAPGRPGRRRRRREPPSLHPVRADATEHDVRGRARDRAGDDDGRDDGRAVDVDLHHRSSDRRGLERDRLHHRSRRSRERVVHERRWQWAAPGQRRARARARLRGRAGRQLADRLRRPATHLSARRRHRSADPDRRRAPRVRPDLLP